MMVYCIKFLPGNWENSRGDIFVKSNVLEVVVLVTLVFRALLNDDSFVCVGLFVIAFNEELETFDTLFIRIELPNYLVVNTISLVALVYYQINIDIFCL